MSVARSMCRARYAISRVTRRSTRPSAGACAGPPAPKTNPIRYEEHIMLSWLKTNTAAARTRLAEEIGKFKNREFMEAVVAGCALVAAADGDISASEKQKMVGFIQ